MTLGLLIGEKNMHGQSHSQDSCFISIDKETNNKLNLNRFILLEQSQLYSVGTFFAVKA